MIQMALNISRKWKSMHRFQVGDRVVATVGDWQRIGTITYVNRVSDQAYMKYDGENAVLQFSTYATFVRHTHDNQR